MLQVIGIVLPIFTVIGLGKAAVHWRVFDAVATANLTKFAVYFLIPALTFGIIAEARPANVTAFSLAYLAGCSMIYLLGLAATGWFEHPTIGHRAVFALDAVWSNAVFLGTPLISAVWGTEGLGYLVGIMVSSTAFLPMSVALMEVDASTKSGSTIITGVLISLVRNPIIVSTVLALAWRLAVLPVPLPLHMLIELLGRCAAPVGLFCLGMSLPQMTREVVREAAVCSVLKLLVMPVVVGVICYLVGFTGTPLSVAVLVAAMPTGANAFLIARGTTRFGDSSATTVVLATFLSMITLPILLYLMVRI
ncbi:MAG TPA: AEC family transporter [Rhodopila sp.]|nr:AEC family transporter [Rhodopila sp.]